MTVEGPSRVRDLVWELCGGPEVKIMKWDVSKDHMRQPYNRDDDMKVGGVSRNPRKFRHSKSSPARSASRSIILPPLWNVQCPFRGEDTKRNFKHAKRLRRSHERGCGAAETVLDRGWAMFPSDNRR